MYQLSGRGSSGAAAAAAGQGAQGQGGNCRTARAPECRPRDIHSPRPPRPPPARERGQYRLAFGHPADRDALHVRGATRGWARRIRTTGCSSRPPRTGETRIPRRCRTPPRGTLAQGTVEVRLWTVRRAGIVEAAPIAVRVRRRHPSSTHMPSSCRARPSGPSPDTRSCRGVSTRECCEVPRQPLVPKEVTAITRSVPSSPVSNRCGPPESPGRC